MPKLIIQRPNGSIEYAELNPQKDNADEQYLAVSIGGKTYYAPLAVTPDTHMYVETLWGQKLYVQNDSTTLVRFNYRGTDDDYDSENWDFKLLSPNPSNINGAILHSLQKERRGSDTKIILYLNASWTGTITVQFYSMKAVFKFKNYYSASCTVTADDIRSIINHAPNNPFKVSAKPG